MAYQHEFWSSDLKKTIKARASARKVIRPQDIAEELLDELGLTDPTIRHIARRGLVAFVRETMAEENPETGVPDFEKLPGRRDEYAPTLAFHFSLYEQRALELCRKSAGQDIRRIVKRRTFAERRWGRRMALPAWVDEALAWVESLAEADSDDESEQ